ncbi:Serine proteinase stubble-like protein [Dinothrombium tinctorium]|uniref:Serine proteinase stubble-like protein n=1 Tax=Dinothrombium tinctorium TaxID=1965070 RepID=A0A3S3Q763_9ACAR|nr:Serine proteinase stubble-like protein [Dinothrombium tinctorium]
MPDNSFKWLDGSRFDFSHWASQPKLEEKEKCKAIVIYFNGYWAMPCGWKYTMFCQRQVEPTVHKDLQDYGSKVIVSLKERLSDLEERLKELKDKKQTDDAGDLVDDDTCGIRVYRRGLALARIAGQTAKPVRTNEIPWQVGIEHNGLVIGGGVILNKRWILTAAHVFLNSYNASKYRGIVGTVEASEAIYVFFDRLILHYDYKRKPNDFHNDIALLRTNKDMRLYPKWNLLNSACLPTPGEEFEGEVIVSGWGHIDSEGTPAKRLKKVDLQIFDDKICESQFNKSYDKKIMICAGSYKGGKDTCMGDSGGPMVKIVDTIAYVVGIVSYGIHGECGKSNVGSVYTKVSSFIEWIYNYI